MTSFARYYKDYQLHNFSMSDIEKLIEDKKNQKLIADLIYQRYYERYLKIFYFDSSQTAKYTDEKGKAVIKEVYKTEYKNGFVIMASCCLLIETISSFLKGNDKTPNGKESFDNTFSKAKEYKNGLKIFQNKNLYKHVRCGILHQGETYNKFKIRRTGKLYNATDNAINATKFYEALHQLLKSYTGELKESKWDGELWDNCRIKLRHIIRNSH